jgi:RNA polymerase sigma factor (sigma-70 family)
VIAREKETTSLDPRAERDLVQRAQAGETVAAETLVEAHERFIAWIASRHRTPVVSFEDLMQAGREGLLKAIGKFTPEHGYRLTTYAYRWVDGEIRRTVREAFLIPVPQKQANIFARAAMAREELREELGRPASSEEVAESLGVPAKTIAELDELARAVVTNLSDYVPETSAAPDPVEQLTSNIRRSYSEAEVEQLLESYAPLWSRLETARVRPHRKSRGRLAQAEGNLRVRLIDIDQAIELLPEDQYAAVTLVSLYGVGFEEAARVLGVHANTVRNRYRRAVTALTAHLNGVPLPGSPRKRRPWRNRLQVP